MSGLDDILRRVAAGELLGAIEEAALAAEVEKLRAEAAAERERSHSFVELVRNAHPCDCETCEFCDPEGCEEPSNRSCEFEQNLWQPRYGKGGG